MPQPHASPECRWLAELFLGNSHHTRIGNSWIRPRQPTLTAQSVLLSYHVLACQSVGASGREGLGALFGNFDVISGFDGSYWSSHISQRQRLLMQMHARHVFPNAGKSASSGPFLQMLEVPDASFWTEINLHYFCVSASSCSELHDARRRSVANANTIKKYTRRSLHTCRTYLSIK